MDYGKLGLDLVKAEKENEKNEEAVADKAPVVAAKPTSAPSAILSDSQRKCTRVVTSMLRRAVCNGVAKTLNQALRWDMDGFARRVDDDAAVCDAFDAVAEKRLPGAFISSPEIIVTGGFIKHAIETKNANATKKTYADTTATPVVVGDDVFEVDIDPHAPNTNIVRPPLHDALAVDVDTSEFGFKNSEDEFVDPPRSVLDSLFTGRKRPRSRVTQPLDDASTPNRRKKQRQRQSVVDDITPETFDDMQQ